MVLVGRICINQRKIFFQMKLPGVIMLVALLKSIIIWTPHFNLSIEDALKKLLVKLDILHMMLGWPPILSLGKFILQQCFLINFDVLHVTLPWFEMALVFVTFRTNRKIWASFDLRKLLVNLQVSHKMFVWPLFLHFDKLIIVQCLPVRQRWHRFKDYWKFKGPFLPRIWSLPPCR